MFKRKIELFYKSFEKDKREHFIQRINGISYFCKSYNKDNRIMMLEYERVQDLKKILNIPEPLLNPKNQSICFKLIENSRSLEQVLSNNRIQGIKIEGLDLRSIFMQLGKDLSRVHKELLIYSDFGLCNFLIGNDCKLYYIDPSFTPLNNFKIQYLNEEDRYYDIAVLSVSLFVHTNTNKILNLKNNFKRLSLFNSFLTTYEKFSNYYLTRTKILNFSLITLFNDLYFNIRTRTKVQDKIKFLTLRLISIFLFIGMYPFFKTGINLKKK